MKIAICNNNLAGVYMFRRDLIRHFVESGHEVILLYAILPKEENYLEELRKICRCIPVKMNPRSQNPLRDILLYYEIKGIYEEEKPAIVFNYTIKPNIYSARAAHALGIPVISMMPGLGRFFLDNSLKSRMAQRLYKWGLDVADRVVVLNQHSYDVVVDRFVDKDRLLLFRGGEGVNMEEYAYCKNNFSEIRFLFIARLLYDKGYQEFMDAAKIVKQQHPEVHFEVLGEVCEALPLSVKRPTLDKDCRENGVEYLGFVGNVPSIVKRDGVVVVVPSYYLEGMNRALMEACAMGRPIITTDMPGCKEQVVDGKTGYIVQTKNANALADAFLRFIGLSQEEKQQMARASYEHCKDGFDLKDVIHSYEEIINQVIK